MSNKSNIHKNLTLHFWSCMKNRFQTNKPKLDCLIKLDRTSNNKRVFSHSLAKANGSDYVKFLAILLKNLLNAQLFFDYFAEDCMHIIHYIYKE